jgi:hypothetical protein
MRHEDRPKRIPEAVQATHFPVYGLVNHPFDLSVCSHGLGISPLAHLMSISLTFTSPRYSSSPRHAVRSQNFEITSVDTTAQQQERVHMIFELKDQSEGRFFDKRTGQFRLYDFSEEAQKQAGNPLVWEGMLSIADTVFSGKILHWAHLLQFSAFLLKSEKTLLIGHAYGPSYDELIQLLENLQVINHQDNLLNQYQYEFDDPHVPLFGKQA